MMAWLAVFLWGAAVGWVWCLVAIGGRADDATERGHGWRAGASGRWP